jgi:predicted DNA-binding protein (MmcQ/YjbR family)
MAKQLISVIFIFVLITSTAVADEYEAVRLCMKNWGTHPFNASKPKYRVIGKKVKVFGIGGNINDTSVTAKPELVLIKPNVSVMSVARMYLMNPNGWYCIHNKVNVMSKTEINLHCKAHLATTKDGVAVLAKDEKEQGVTVLGKATIIRKCE